MEPIDGWINILAEIIMDNNSFNKEKGDVRVCAVGSKDSNILTIVKYKGIAGSAGYHVIKKSIFPYLQFDCKNKEIGNIFDKIDNDNLYNIINNYHNRAFFDIIGFSTPSLEEKKEKDQIIFFSIY